MANSGRKDDNGSQFFLTLGDTPELTGKNTLFGKIVGDTVYNLVRMGELETEEGGDRPLFPPKVTGAEVLVNPYEDVGPKEAKNVEVVGDKGKKKAAAKKKKKGGKALLSFAADEEDEAPQPIRKKPKFDTRLVVDTAETVREREEAQAAARAQEPEKAPEAPELPKPAGTTVKAPIRIPSSRSPSPEIDRSAELLARTNAQIAALKKSLRRSASPPPAAASTATPQKKVSLLKLQKQMLPPTSIQGRKRRSRRDDEDEESFRALKRFQEKLTSAPSESTNSAADPSAPKAAGEADAGAEQDAEALLCDLHFIPNCQSCSQWDKVEEGKEGEEEEGAREELWGHALSFEKDRLGKDLTWKKKNDELVVIDPREKEKEILGKRKGGGGGGGAERASRKREDEKRAGRR